MRCLSCDSVLSDYEATRKYPNKKFIDLCNGCYRYIKYDVYAVDRPDLEGAIDELEINQLDD